MRNQSLQNAIRGAAAAAIMSCLLIAAAEPAVARTPAPVAGSATTLPAEPCGNEAQTTSPVRHAEDVAPATVHEFTAEGTCTGIGGRSSASVTVPNGETVTQVCKGWFQYAWVRVGYDSAIQSIVYQDRGCGVCLASLDDAASPTVMGRTA